MDQKNEEGQTLTDHLTELRTRLIRCLWGILAGLILCYNFTEQLFDWIRAPIAPYLQAGGLVFTSPMDKFIAHLKIAFFGGIIVSCPFWIYQLWRFVAPGLYAKERKYTLIFIFSGSVLFLLGVAFTYFAVFPMAFKFLMGYGGDIDKPMITIDHYMSFFMTTSLAFGAAFEMPLIITILGMMGIVSKKFLQEKRRYSIMTIATIAAIITPPDLLSMVLMLVPMWLLYELSILIVGFIEQKREREFAET